MKRFLVLVSVGSLLMVAPVGAQAACTTSKSSGTVKVGSAISGDSIVLCASSSTAKTTTTTKSTGGITSTAKRVSTVVKKVVAPCVIRVSSMAAVNDPRVPGCTYAVVAPAKPVVTAPKTAASTVSASSSQNDQAAFTPNPVGISASPSVGQVGQAFFFTALAEAHSRSGIVLGQAAQVTFTPVSFDWESDDGATGSGTSLVTNWSTEGAHSVTLTVGYSVAYSVGAGWIEAGIIKSTASTTVQVVAAPVPVAVVAKPPLLVSGNCRARPGSYRC